MERSGVAVLLALVIVTVTVVGAITGNRSYWSYVAAIAFGVIVAIAELVARYRDDPAAALLTMPALIYLSINGIASGGALYLAHVFAWDFGADGNGKAVTQVLVAGFGSAALFRSSLFNVTAGDQVIGIGPSAVLTVTLQAADRAVDRKRGLRRSAAAVAALRGLSFAAAADSLRNYVAAVMQNVSAEELKAIDDTVSGLRDPKNNGLSDQLKTYILGLRLLTITGSRVLFDVADRVRTVSPPASVAASQPDNAPSTAVLNALRAQKGPLSISALSTASGLSYAELGAALNALAANGIVTVAGSPGEEVVTAEHEYS